MTIYDEVIESNGDDKCRAWLRKVIDAKDAIVDFVDNRLDGGGAGTFIGFLKGSFNLSLHIGFGDRRPSALIRFPKPGHTTWRAEKVANEVRSIQYLSQHTSIPLPRVFSWGLMEESPLHLGPFIIMDFIDGTRLSTFLKQPTENDQEDVVLNPDFDNAKLDIIYDQLADYMLQISRLNFSRIGAISKDHSTETWSVTGRPLTYNMNELATLTGYPIDQSPTAPFDCASDYFNSVANAHLIHLQTQLNLASDAEDAQRRFIARNRFVQLIPKYYINDAGPFKIFCDDMQPSNMLINPDTLRITAFVDIEFTNTMPAQFVSDPPWWLLLLGPDMWLEHYTMEEFLTRFEPKLEQFLRALERVEENTALLHDDTGEQRLSTQMRESWETGRFWFDYASRKSLDVDAIYWTVLHKDSSGIEMLDERTLANIKPFTQMKMTQLEAYKKKYAAHIA